jgi:predicted RNA binding protein YcfA (HicA-like mRNA interferase family)
MAQDLSAITGFQLIRLLELDGWQRGLRGTHGQHLYKYLAGERRTLVTVVPRTRASLPRGTLGGILSVKQTRLGRAGLVALIRAHGLR